MNAYNPITGQTIEISEYGFQMLEAKGWKRAVDQSPRVRETPPQIPVATPVDMRVVMEQKKKELEEMKKQQLQPAEIIMLDEATVTQQPPSTPKPKTTKTKAAPVKVSGKQTTKKK